MKNDPFKLFQWTGILWQAKPKLNGKKYLLAIRADETNVAAVNKLAPLAVRFPEFWENNGEVLIESARDFVARYSQEKAAQCIAKNVAKSEFGWTLETFTNQQREFVYWQILLEFTVDGESILGEESYVQLRNVLTEDLLTSRKNMDIQLVSF